MPLHGAQSADDDELSATLAAAGVRATASRRSSRPGPSPTPTASSPGSRPSGCAARSARGAGTSSDGPFAAPADEVLDRQRAVRRTLAGRRPGRGLGHARRPRPRVRRAARRRRRPRPVAGTGMTMHLSPTSSDPEGYLARTGRRPVVHLDAPRRARPHLLLGPRRVARRRRGRGSAREPARPSPTARGRTCASARASRAPAGTPSSSSAAGGWRSAATPSNAGDLVDILRAAAVAAGIARDTRIDPERFGAHTGVRAGHDRRRRGDRDGRPHRLARARQAGRPRRARHRRVGRGRRAATSGCSSCGAPTAGRCATSWSTASRWSATAAASPSTPTPSGRRRRPPSTICSAGRDHGPPSLAPRRRPLRPFCP